jgi:hypothetical protein
VITAVVKLVFHEECCARADGNRQTVSLHIPPPGDPIFALLPLSRLNINTSKKSRKNEQSNVFKSCQACSKPVYEEDDDVSQILCTHFMKPG